MGELTARAFTEQSLLDAWAGVRENALEDGFGGPEVDRFEASAAKQVSKLAEQLTAGRWQPSPVFRVEIAKSSGGHRLLGIPTLVDRIVERALLAELDPIIDPLLLPWSFAYRRGLGVRDAISRLVESRDEGATWVARADIDDCFDRIPRWEVLRRLREVLTDVQALELIRQLMARPVVGRRRVVADRGLGLHQGSVLSPLLCNLYLDRFDREMLGLGWMVIRYADDFAISAPDRAGAERALTAAHEVLHLLQLELNPAKTRLVSFDEGVEFLGQTVTASTGVGLEALSHPLETVVYVDRQGSLLRSRGERLVVEAADEKVFSLNLRRIRQVVCYGRVGFTTAFLHQAVRRGIDVVLLTADGGPGGRLQSLSHSDPTVRRAQYRVADDVSRCLELASAFIDGKIANMRVALLRADRRSPNAERTDTADTLEILRLSLPDAKSVAQLLGYEGTASREYFRGLRMVVGPDWGFSSRQRRPPPDPVNAMLSYGYTILLSEAVAALGVAGLDPAVGFLHQVRWGRPNLALDLMEEFRAVIVDVAVVRCLTTGMVRFEEFEVIDGNCRMSQAARLKFVAAYERRMLTLFTHTGSGRRVSYRVGLTLQAKALARAVLDDDRPYRPIRWR